MITKKIGMEQTFEKNERPKVLGLFLHTKLIVRKRSMTQGEGISERRKSCRRQKTRNRIQWKVKELVLTGKEGIFPLLYKEGGIMQVGL